MDQFIGGAAMTNETLQQNGVNGDLLRELYKTDTTAKRVFDDLSRRQRNYAEVKVARMATRVWASRRAVIQVFRKLEGAGCGEFVVGRGGWESRFVWTVGMVEVGKYAKGEEAPIQHVEPTAGLEPEAEEPDEGAPGTSVQLFNHGFQLRPDLRVSLQLPRDLTAGEASRLAEFVKTLPF